MVIDRYRGHTRVTVDAPVWKTHAVSARAYSSAIEGRALMAEEWPEGLAGRIARRMADNHGGEKGRVLYIGRRTRAEERPPSRLSHGICLTARWSCWSSTSPKPSVSNVRTLVGPCGVSLLALLRAIAAHAKLDRPDDRLAWITDDDEIARRAYEQ